MRTWTSYIHIHDTQVEQLKAACRDLTTELEKERLENGRLQDANANVGAERRSVASKLGELRAQHSQLQGEHAGLKGQFEELASQRSEAVQHLEELETEHRQLPLYTTCQQTDLQFGVLCSLCGPAALLQTSPSPETAGPQNLPRGSCIQFVQITQSSINFMS